MNSESSKVALRTLFLKKRLELSKAEHEEKSFAIANHCFAIT